MSYSRNFEEFLFYESNCQDCGLRFKIYLDQNTIRAYKDSKNYPVVRCNNCAIEYNKSLERQEFTLKYKSRKIKN